MNLMHLTGLPVIENQTRTECPASLAEILDPPGRTETGTGKEMCLQWNTGALRSAAMSPIGLSHRGGQEPMITVWRNDWPVRGKGRREDSTVHTADGLDHLKELSGCDGCGVWSGRLDRLNFSKRADTCIPRVRSKTSVTSREAGRRVFCTARPIGDYYRH